ncbi:uncharacterized protein LOC143562696 [Bidens hawaiensis]|uniref:uncharacterized protein LOC143562696 n=1 Tax=Bidens hawaiensis TaxID=980011 RepID=UPI00404AB398
MSPVKPPDEFTARDAQNKDKIVVEKDETEELPPGWTKEVRTRKTGSRTKVDRYYTDPVTGYVFLSLKDVQRYLKTGELGRLAIKPKIDEKQKPSELKEQKSETLSHKRAPTGKSASPARASKRLAGGNSDAQPPSSLLSPSPPEPKTRRATRLAGIKVDSPSLQTSSPEPKTGQATQLARVTVDAPPTSPPEPKTRQARRLAGVTVDEPPLSSPEPKTRQATRQAGIKIDSPPPLPPDSKTRQATPVMGIEIDTSPPSKPEPKTRQATPVTETETGTSPPSKPKPKTRQAKPSAASPQPKTRRATRQSGIKIDSPPSPPDTRTNRQPTRTRPVNSTTPQKNNKKTEPEKPTENRNQNADVDANMNDNQENPIIPPSNQESNKNQIQTTLEKQKSPVVNPTITNPVPQSDSSINFSMSDLWTDPCIEFAVKTLTGAIPFTDLNKVESFTPAPSPAPLQDIWTDPCIEFAVKTLTGAIPVTEGDYLPHKPAASSSHPAGAYNFSSPMNAYQTGYNNKQQEPVFPTLGNGGLQKSGKFVNGTNGQCSRSRFYK